MNTGARRHERSWLTDGRSASIAIISWFSAFVLVANIAPSHESHLSMIWKGAESFMTSIEAYAALSSFPEASRIVLFLAWLSVPVVTFYCYRPILLLISQNWRREKGILSFAIVMAILATAYLMATNIPASEDVVRRNMIGRMLRGMSESRTVLGFIGAAWSSGLGFGLSVVAATIRTWFGVGMISGSGEKK